MNKMRKMQLTSVKMHLMEAQNKNRKKVENRLETHLGMVRKMFEDYERIARRNFE